MTTTPDQAYNYDVFTPDPYTATECTGPEPGTDLGDVTVAQLDGGRVALADLGDGAVVLETGSTTCPLYRRNIAAMHRIARAHPEVTFAVLYTREAHPGERRGAHRSMADKRDVAATLPEAAGEWRRILVDDLDGRLHRRLEGAPDSITVLDGDGMVLAYFHDGDPRAVAATLDALAAGRQAPRVRARFTPPPPGVALAALRTGGSRAVGDFIRGLPALIAYRLRGGARC